MALLLEARGVISDAAARSDDERIAFFDSLFAVGRVSDPSGRRLRSGDILSGYTVGRTKHSPTSTIRLSRSRDGGVTWAEIPFRFETTQDGIPGSLAGAEPVETADGRLLLATTWFDRSDPARPLFDPVTEGILRSRLLVAESADGGDTWSPWRVVPTPGLTGTALCGPWLTLPDGTLGLAFESFKEFDDPTPARHAAWMLPTRDGRTFGTPFRIAQDPEHQVYYWDERLVATGGPGEFVGLYWTHHRGEKRDLRVHFQRDRVAGTAANSRPVETSIPGQIAMPYVAPDGRIFAFVVDRDAPGTMRLWVSHDHGATWPVADMLEVYVHQRRDDVSQGKENVDFAQYWEDMGKWSFGHPAMIPLDGQFGEGRLLLSWYAGTPERMSVHWARVAM